MTAEVVLLRRNDGTERLMLTDPTPLPDLAESECSAGPSWLYPAPIRAPKADASDERRRMQAIVLAPFAGPVVLLCFVGFVHLAARVWPAIAAWVSGVVA